jgi:predicted nucleic acid-binding protein
LETDAVNLILAKVKQKGRYGLLVSPVHLREIAAIPDAYERVGLEMILDQYGTPAVVDVVAAKQRAEDLVALGFGVADAAHVAFAEQSGIPFVSCDDKLLKKCRCHRISIWCGSPVAYCEKEGLR